MKNQRRTGTYKDESEYNKPGRDFREVISNYKKYTTNFEFRLFLAIPIISSIFIFAFYWFFGNSNADLLNRIMEMNRDSLTVIAILAGFNTTSLSIIAASNNNVLKFLRQHKLPDSEDTLLKQLVSFFSFAILLQLMVLTIGILLSMISKSFMDISNAFPVLSGLVVKIPLTLLGALWLGAVIFVIIISIRNATLLYRYVLFVADYDE